MGKIDDIYKMLLEYEDPEKGITAAQLSQILKLDRANVSRYLNQLCLEKMIEKTNGRPVLYRSLKKVSPGNNEKNSLDAIVGAKHSLQVPIQQAKAAILYPPRGLHTLILGETGVGKSMFAEAMCQFAKEAKMIAEDAPFIRFNCADYADNPQLVMAQIFGVKKGAYSGADSDREGLLKKADHGIFFLDEVHRLSPQGQEMLFTFIDKGFFRPLGETNKLVYSDVQLIAATTEDPQSHLLKTFTRRIPMTITLPSMNERSLQERYSLVDKFICMEAKRLGKDIYVQYNALISFLLYECPNNIGQLKSDIQLACAKAFLHFKSESRNYILIEQSELHSRVKRGILNLQEYRNEINALLNQKDDILVFSSNGDKNGKNTLLPQESYEKSDYFYDVIENKMEQLKKQGLSEHEINELLNIDIDGYFKKYLSDLPEKFRKDEITKVVDSDIVDMVEQILEFAQAQLHREYDEKVYYGLSLHLNKSIERIRQGTYIYHPQLDKIRKKYADEFLAAIQIAKMIDQKFNIETPFDEIGYITMFLASNSCADEENNEKTVQILVIMHGHATASSMAQVANTLLGVKQAHSLDMFLNMKVEQMYEKAKEKIMELDMGKGVLLLVDMGSLSNFASMLTEETGIAVKCIDMVSTPIVIEACHKSMDGSDLEEVYRACKEINNYKLQPTNEKKAAQDFLIITACFTGEGAALRLKEIITQSLGEKKQVEVKAMDILDRNDFLCRVQALNKTYHIIAIVGTVNFQVDRIPSFSAADVLAHDGVLKIQGIIHKEQEYLKIKRSLAKHIQGIDAEKMVEDIRKVIDNLEYKLGVQLSHNVKIGMLLHMSFMVDRLLNQGTAIAFEGLMEYQAQNGKAFALTRQVFRELEHIYKIKLTEDEIAFVVKMCLESNGVDCEKN